MRAEIVRAMAAALEVGQPVMLWGQPGTGKSAIVSALGTALAARAVGDFPVEIVVASLREPVDFAGLPVVTSGSVRLAPPAWAERLASAGQGLLFLDEITTAPPATQAALLRVVRERVIGDLALPEAVVIVAAGNPADMNAGTWDLTSALANRFCHLDWVPDAEVFQNAIVGGFGLPPLLAPHPPVDESQPRSLVAGFIAARPALLHAPPSELGATTRAWPSPRSWEAAARLLAAASAFDLGPGETRLLIEGLIGRAAATEFLAWIEDRDLVNPADALDDPFGVPLPVRMDQRHAACVSVVALALSRGTIAARAAAWQFLVRIGDNGGGAAATAAARRLAADHPAGEAPPPEAATFLDVLRAAGLA